MEGLIKKYTLILDDTYGIEYEDGTKVGLLLLNSFELIFDDCF
jgi:hypothetical protein